MGKAALALIMILTASSVGGFDRARFPVDDSSHAERPEFADTASLATIDLDRRNDRR